MPHLHPAANSLTEGLPTRDPRPLPLAGAAAAALFDLSSGRAFAAVPGAGAPEVVVWDEGHGVLLLKDPDLWSARPSRPLVDWTPPRRPPLWLRASWRLDQALEDGWAWLQTRRGVPVLAVLLVLLTLGAWRGLAWALRTLAQ